MCLLKFSYFQSLIFKRVHSKNFGCRTQSRLVTFCLRKRRTFNLVPQNQEEESAHSSSSSQLTSNACTLKTSFDTTVQSTTDPVLETTFLNDEDQSATVMC